jgi:hypothetical protein
MIYRERPIEERFCRGASLTASLTSTLAVAVTLENTKGKDSSAG